jgi:hypothetical protein
MDVKKLRGSQYHQELGRKMCAAFVAQQQGVTLNTAYKRVPDQVGDLWLMMADFAVRMTSESLDAQFPSEAKRHSAGSLM